MSVWLELHCTWRLAEAHCFTDLNNNEQTLSNDGQVALITAYRHVENNARAKGWIRTTDGWVCPNCYNVRLTGGKN